MDQYPIRVFISYSHDSESHKQRVLMLANRLRQDGVDAWLDQFENEQPVEGWPVWMEKQIDLADFVLLVCTKSYYRRFQVEEVEQKGRGVLWEARLARTLLYQTDTNQQKFIPVLFEGSTDDDVPKILRHHRTHFRMMLDYEPFFRVITGQPCNVPETLGDLKIMDVNSATPTFDVADDNDDRDFSPSIKKRFAVLHKQIACRGVHGMRVWNGSFFHRQRGRAWLRGTDHAQTVGKQRLSP